MGFDEFDRFDVAFPAIVLKIIEEGMIVIPKTVHDFSTKGKEKEYATFELLGYNFRIKNIVPHALEHPMANVKEKWAAQEFSRFLLTPEIQGKAVSHGFRPTTLGVELDREIFDPANGVSYSIPTAVLSSPTDGEVLWHITDIWSTTRARG